MRARIYQPSRNAMQSGTAKSNSWVLEYAHASAREVDPLMGWTSSSDMQSQIKLNFETQKAAEDYAKNHDLEYVVQKPKTRAANVRAGGYGDNFATFRRGVWTH